MKWRCSSFRMAEKVRCAFSSRSRTCDSMIFFVGRTESDGVHAADQKRSHSSQPFAGKRYTRPSDGRHGASAGARSMCETIIGAPQPDTPAHHPPTNPPPPRLPFPPPRACPPLTTTIPTVCRVGGAVATRATIGAARMPRHASGPMVRSLCAPGQPENDSLRSDVSVVAFSNDIWTARPLISRALGLACR